jgi:hypothetical protein
MDMGSLNLAEPAQPAAQPAHQPLGAIENVPPPAPPAQQQKPLFAKVKVSRRPSMTHYTGQAARQSTTCTFAADV